MKAFWSGVAIMLVLAVGAWAVLDTVDMSASGVFSSPQSVRQ